MYMPISTWARRALVGVVMSLALAVTAGAGEFYEKDGAAIRGYDPVAYFEGGKPVKGLPEHRVEHRGSVFLFSSTANRGAFVANPRKYAPQYDGFCAFGVAGGYKASVDPVAFTVVDGRLYLNYSKSVQRQWSADIPGMIAKGNRNWPKVSRQTKVIE
jgi:YHS domain-containing protein